MHSNIKYLAALPVVGLIAGLAACGSAHTTTKIPLHYTTPPVHSAPAIRSSPPSPTVTHVKPAPKPAATPSQTQVPAPVRTPVPPPGYLGNIAGGGTGNPCNFASGYQYGVCNPTGETQQQYITNPGGPAPGTPTNSQGCYYVRMGEGYCPSTGQDVPMQDPNNG